MSRLVTALLLLPSTALACPVCGASGLNNDAYLDSTIFLSLVPLAMLGTVGGVVWYVARAAAAADSATHEAVGGQDQRAAGAADHAG